MINATTPISSFQLAMGNSPSEPSFMHGKSLEIHDWWTNPSLTRAEKKMRALNRWRYKSIRPCYEIIHLCTPHSGDTHHRNTYCWVLYHKRVITDWEHSNQPEEGLDDLHPNYTAFLVIWCLGPPLSTHQRSCYKWCGFSSISVLFITEISGKVC